MPTLTCRFCSKPFPGNCNFNKYCSAECAFWRWVEKKSKTECWEWIGTRFHHGYGRMKFRRKVWYASRFSWELHNGQIPTGKIICHHCDNPPCCNPNHLFCGTYKGNADDRDRKGREIFLKGEDHWSAKLTEENVRTIRSMYESGIRGKELEGAFGLVKGYGWRIAMGKAWKHVR